ncbi:hypothetical protein D0Z00_000260 [Geotrichum galactomycetum]|uniref:Uncharacterized protein n=1 Tax=Geotrichum galactomycetum TaxID=27317 RepID=A0ACB6VAL9_9ASCO|nr:hypothetical protein D0Z00_000260 [Geotrichum candidum]
MLLKSVTISTIVSLAAAQNCNSLYYQCGGINWNGTTCCEAGSYCKVQNPYYHQCVADVTTNNNTLSTPYATSLNNTVVQTSVVDSGNWNSTLVVPHIPTFKTSKARNTVYVTKSASGQATLTVKNSVESAPATLRHKHSSVINFNTSLVENVIAPSSTYESSVNTSIAQQSSTIESFSSEISTLSSSTSQQTQPSTFVSEEVSVPSSSSSSSSSVATATSSVVSVSPVADSVASAASSVSAAPASTSSVVSKTPVSSADNELTFTPIVGGKSGTGKTTRYWDCCKPSCSWSGKADVSSPVAACKADGKTISDVNDQSGCNGGDSYMCSNQQPFALNSTLAFGFVAASMVGYSESNMCCTCVLLSFNDGAIAGKQMVAQVTNTGSDLSSNHFDIAMPGGGFGIFSQGCPNQWNSPASNWGQTYGGVSSEAECANLPSALQTGCDWRWDFLENADNPSVSFVEIECPSQITDITGCKRN